MEKEKRIKLKLKFKIVIAIIIIILYSFFIGTKFIFTKDILIKSEKINKDLSGAKILQFSDLHYNSQINKYTVKNLVKKINETKADIVIFSGDLIDQRYNPTKDDIDFLKSQLSKINATYGKYFIQGEEDNEDSSLTLTTSDFYNLSSGEQIIYFNKTPIVLLDVSNTKNYFEINSDSNYYKLLVIHNPDDLDDVLDYNFDIAIAGHTHNGQINIPKVKELFIKSKYKKTYQKVKNTELYINPGIGNSVINARLFNHPTIYLYRLKGMLKTVN